MQIIDKCLTQGRDKSQRTATKQHRERQVITSRQGYHRLHRHGMKHRSGNVGLIDILGQEILNIGLGENSTPRCNGINGMSLHGQIAHGLDGNSQQQGHLVNKSTRSTGTISIHAQIGRLIFMQKNHLGIFASYVDNRPHLWIKLRHITGGRHNLLYKRNPAALGNSHTHATREGELAGGTRKALFQFVKKEIQQRTHSSLMPFVTGINRTTCCIENHHLGGSRAYI